MRPSHVMRYTDREKDKIRQEFRDANSHDHPDLVKMKEMLREHQFLREEVDLDSHIITVLNMGIGEDIMHEMDVIHNKGGYFQDQFVRHLLESNSPETYKNVSKQNRRLDSLARILENDGTCTAVYLDSGRLLIASNSITARSRTGDTASDHYRFIERAMDYFKSCVDGGSPDWQKRKDFIIELSKNVLAEKLRFSSGIAEILATDIKRHYDDFYSRDPLIHTKIWRDDVLAHEDDPNQKAIIIHLSRTLRDFRKIEKSLMSADPDKEDKEKVLTTHISNGAEGYEILRIGTAKTHAEMKILAKIITDNYQKLVDEDSEEYIGISKLCCAHCIHVIKSSFDESLVRGEHGKKFEWDMPEFLREGVNAKLFKKFIGKGAFELFEEMDDYEQQEALKFVRNPDLSREYLAKILRYGEAPHRSINMDAADSTSDEEIELRPTARPSPKGKQALLALAPAAPALDGR